MTADTDGAAEFETHRGRLFAIAYRMLGSAAEAEDAVQDTYLRWHAADRSAVATPAAWLTRVLANLCVNRLTSARVRRERYPGPWLPEPVLTGSAAGEAPLGPLETAEQRDSVSFALLTLMERLTPVERAVFVLREAFGYSHREVAGILDTTEESSRQAHRRARQRLAGERRFEPSPRHWRETVHRFLDAARGGDLAELEKLLAEDVVFWSDGGGRASASRRPVPGREKVLRLLGGLLRQLTPEHELRAVEVNGAPAVLVLLSGEPVSVLVPEGRDGRVAAVRTVVNPDKLGFLAEQLARTPPTKM
ncbi:RNA polymerase sigma-70 factor [Thermobifida halotolerans]|uniref:RNA polymerase sigma-70 factor n=1 Tax=Thermobifida halotolerans TaxID=483545 RepID=A0A399G617_9ACTN|nr:RNA polymerase sigma-70 factor [Thermobifida halotolerans]UOE20903.1 RNA polymerase sigma-70 factor [Thermobifida halotolerans]